MLTPFRALLQTSPWPRQALARGLDHILYVLLADFFAGCIEQESCVYVFHFFTYSFKHNPSSFNTRLVRQPAGLRRRVGDEYLDYLGNSNQPADDEKTHACRQRSGGRAFGIYFLGARTDRLFRKPSGARDGLSRADQHYGRSKLAARRGTGFGVPLCGSCGRPGLRSAFEGKHQNPGQACNDAIAASRSRVQGPALIARYR